MTDINGIIRQLEQERNRIDSAIHALRAVGSHNGTTRPKRTLSVAARRRIAAAQRARWAKVKARKK